MKAPGSPAWRKAGRPAAGEMPVKPLREPADLSDLDGKTAAELKEIAERDALRALIAQTRRPTRHATAVVSAARNLLDFSSSKPAQAVAVTGGDGGPVKSEHTIRFVEPEPA